MNCTCPETTRSYEHSPECNLRRHLAEAKKTIDAFAKESLQDKEKLRESENLAVCLEMEYRGARLGWKAVGAIYNKEISKLRNSVANVERRATELERERDEAQAAFAATGHQLSETEEDRQNASHLWSEEKKKRIELEKRVARYTSALEGVRDAINNYAWNILQDALKECPAPTRSPTGYICPNCSKPSPMMGHARESGGWTCV